MQTQSFWVRAFASIIGFAALVFSAAASADPPSRVARLGYLAGAVSLSVAGEDAWDQATLNRPLSIGDRLWVEEGARAEIQDGGTLIRMHASTGISVLNLDDASTQLQLTQGSLNLRVRRLAPNQVFEVITPQLALTLRQRGDYRIAVDPQGNLTDVIVRSGQAEVSGPGAGYLIDAQQRYRFRGNDLRDNEFLAAPRPDEFDQWASERDRALDRSVSARYVSRDVIGYQDLDANGVWGVDATYGNVWYPNQVGPDWAPYRDGHWTWIAPWGWTWVDDAPWGFAVSHYGRWANLGNRWAWVPGPMRARAYYAPALVAFVGGDNFGLAISSGNGGGIGWFALAPREVYRPSYVSSRSYFENVNRSNTVISVSVINNSYNTRDRDDHNYANRRIPGAMVAVPKNTFISSQHVPSAAVRVAPESLHRAPLVAAPQFTPGEHRRGGTAPAVNLPPARSFERPGVTRIVPPVNVPATAPEPRARPQGRDNGPQRPPVNAAPVSSPQMPATPQAPVQPQQQARPQPQPPDQRRPRAPEPKVVVPQAAVPAPLAKPVETRAPEPAGKARAAAPAPTPAQGQVGPKEEPRGQRATPAEGKPKEAEEGRDGPRRQEERRKPVN